MKTYQPKRARKQWMADAPEYVLSVYDNGGKTCDRFTVLIGGTLHDEQLNHTRSVAYLAMSDNPTHPQGFSQWGEMPSANRQALGKHIAWNDLPENIRAHVISRCTQS